MSNWALNGLFFIWTVSGVYISQAAVALGGSTDADVKNAYWYALAASITIWILALVTFILYILSIFGVVDVLTPTSDGHLSTGGVLYVIAMILIVIVVGVLSLLAAISLGKAGPPPELSSAFHSTLIASGLTLGSLALIFLGVLLIQTFKIGSRA